MFGFRNEDWKEWTLFDGTPVLVPGKFNTAPDENGNILNYPLGDCSVAPSGKMPKGGYYFDAIIRQHELDDAALNVQDNLEEFTVFPDEYLRYHQENTDRLYKETDKAILGTPGGCALGDIALVPGVNLKDPKGIRDIEEWYVSILLRKDYITEFFDRQTDIAIQNLKLYHQAVGEKIVAIYLCGTDFGTQIAPFCSKETFSEVYMPYYQKMTRWIHENTLWKVFKHTCGSIEPLIDSIIEAGIDILNPVQCSATNMEPKMLKEKYGDRVVFWGGGVDTQKTLPYANPEKVREEVLYLCDIFARDGGFVFNTVHNTQANVPVENIVAMVNAIQEFNGRN
jgi:hypothetical protein